MRTAEQQVAEFVKKMKRLGKQLSAAVIAAILADKEWRKGEDLERLAYVAGTLPVIERLFAESGWSSIYRELVRQNPKLFADIRAIHKAIGTSSVISAERRQMLTALARTDLNEFRAIGEAGIRKVHSLLSESVLTGKSDREVIKEITEFIDKDFQRYAKTYAQTSRNRYLQESEKLIAEQMKEDGIDVYWQYAGPADDKNRDECIWALDKEYFTEEEMENFEAEGYRWNCRHIFIAINKDIYDAKVKTEDDLTQEERDRRDELLRVMNGEAA